MKVRTDGATHFILLRALPGHVPLHCLWAYGKGRGHLNSLEHAHVEACNDCSTALRVCCEADSFGVVLKRMGPEHDDPPMSDEKPKLKTLYVFPDPFR